VKLRIIPWRTRPVGCHSVCFDKPFKYVSAQLRRKGVNTMMDLSSVIDAGLVVLGSIAVLLMGLWTLSAESSTVSISEPPVSAKPIQVDLTSLPKAA